MGWPAMVAISDTVRDASGAVVPGATVTANNRETVLERSVQSGPDGHYQLSGLPIGIYDVKDGAWGRYLPLSPGFPLPFT